MDAPMSSAGRHPERPVKGMCAGMLQGRAHAIKRLI